VFLRLSCHLAADLDNPWHDGRDQALARLEPGRFGQEVAG
jgi:hypothetical protein